MVYLISKLYFCLEKMSHVGTRLRLNKNILEVPPFALYLMEGGRVSELEDGC